MRPQLATRALTAGDRFTWIDTRCVDGELDLAQVGFDRDLVIEQAARGQLLLAIRTEVERDNCSTLALWEASPAPRAGVDVYRFRAWPAVVLPGPQACGAEEYGQWAGRISLEHDILTMVLQDSRFCRGFDARFRFRRTVTRAPTSEDIVRSYVAQFNRQDAQAVAELFADEATLTEPFSRVERGSLANHEGRDAIFAWHADAFAGNHWSALRLLSLRPGQRADEWWLRWEYMDNKLQQPFEGRTRMIIRDGVIQRADIAAAGVIQPASG